MIYIPWQWLGSWFVNSSWTVVSYPWADAKKDRHQNHRTAWFLFFEDTFIQSNLGWIRGPIVEEQVVMKGHLAEACPQVRLETLGMEARPFNWKSNTRSNRLFSPRFTNSINYRVLVFLTFRIYNDSGEGWLGTDCFGGISCCDRFCYQTTLPLNVTFCSRVNMTNYRQTEKLPRTEKGCGGSFPTPAISCSGFQWNIYNVKKNFKCNLKTRAIYMGQNNWVHVAAGASSDEGRDDLK